MGIEMVELRPTDGRKSFYGKAVAFYHEATNSWLLRSYDTMVASYYLESGYFVRLWDGYSMTTMRHINAFLSFLGHEPKGKAWWIDIDIFDGVYLKD